MTKFLRRLKRQKEAEVGEIKSPSDIQSHVERQPSQNQDISEVHAVQAKNKGWTNEPHLWARGRSLVEGKVCLVDMVYGRI